MLRDLLAKRLLHHFAADLERWRDLAAVETSDAGVDHFDGARHLETDHARLDAVEQRGAERVFAQTMAVNLASQVDEAAVDEQLEKLAQSNKSWEEAPKKHAARSGDLVVIDFAGTVDGEPFEGGSGEDMSVEIGSGQLIPGFEDGLIGARAGDEREVSVKFPDDYPAEKLKGKPASFAVTVKAVKTAGESRVDEAFAKSLGLKDLA
mgnify:CR=1 FL=1